MNTVVGINSSFTGGDFQPVDQPQGQAQNKEFVMESNLDSDEDYRVEENIARQGPGNYAVGAPKIPCTKFENMQSLRDNKGVPGALRDGYGISECNVDIDSKYRIGKPKACPKNRNQLFQRPYLTVPYMANGNLSEERMDIESELLSGDYQMDPLPLAGVSLFDNHVKVPLTRNLSDNIQNPIHLVEEIADQQVPNSYADAWIRGGIPTRQEVKDVDYLERSTDSEYVKDLFLRKKQYVFS